MASCFRVKIVREIVLEGKVSNRKSGPAAFLALAAMLGSTLGLGVNRVSAQGATATILGSVADASGAALPDASVQVKNAGTGATQVVSADAQGRFRLPGLLVGDYEIQVWKIGFSTVVRKEITLTVGSQDG